MRLMYDAVDYTQIPRDTHALVAGYADGRISRWPYAAWLAFPNAQLVEITTDPNSGEYANVIDVETGDYTPAQAVIKMQWLRARGIQPTVYCTRTGQAEVIAACRAANVLLPHWWLAIPNGVPELLPGVVAVQFLWGSVRGGPLIDVSVVADFWPGVDRQSPPMTTVDAGDIYAWVQAAEYNASHVGSVQITGPSNTAIEALPVEGSKRVYRVRKG